MKVPFVDLEAQYQSISAEIDNAIREVVLSTRFVGGKWLSEFEEQFAEFCDAKYAIGVSSGTDALRLALVAAGVGEGHEVITVPNTFIATTEAVTSTGASVRFVDVDPKTHNIDVAQIEGVINENTRAILPIHLYGQPCDMDPIIEIARKRDLVVIEDACQAHGAEYKGRRVGAIGNAGCFSFFPAKNLGAYGDGGCVVTNNEAVAEKVRLLRDHGRVDKYTHRIEGSNSRLDTIQAAILLAKLKHLDAWNAKRRAHAELYGERLASVEGIVIPEILDTVVHVFHLYVIRTQRRDALMEALKEAGVSTGIHYPVPLHLQPAYDRLGLKEGSFPVTEECAKRILSLPMFPELREQQIDSCCEIIRKGVCGI